MVVGTTFEDEDFRDKAQAPAARVRTPVEVTAAVLGGRHAALIVWNLFWGGKGFFQLLRDMEDVPRRTLAFELEELERNGIVHKRIQHFPSPKVSYTLTPLGTSLKVVVGTMYEWGLMVRDLPAAAKLVGKEAPGFAHSNETRTVRFSDAGEDRRSASTLQMSEVEAG